MRILYIGDSSPACTSRHRAQALERLGHEVLHVDPKAQFPWPHWRRILHFRTGYRLLNRSVRRFVRSEAARPGSHYDLIWVDNGELVPRALLRELRLTVCTGPIINYNCDDVTGPRDGPRWGTLLGALPEYDLCAVVRPPNTVEYPKKGARAVFRVFMSADEVAHAPRPLTDALRARWAGEVVFIGTWMPERGPFICALMDAGIPVTIRGDRWTKAPEWPRLRGIWKGESLKGDDYAYAIQCARVNLGLLSKGNRDLHTQRSFEIPALGGLFCAERTSEHRQLYHEGAEALFWDDAAECARVVKAILADEPRRKAVAVAGQERHVANKQGNQDIVQAILNQVYPALALRLLNKPISF